MPAANWITCDKEDEESLYRPCVNASGTSMLRQAVRGFRIPLSSTKDLFARTSKSTELPASIPRFQISFYLEIAGTVVMLLIGLGQESVVEDGCSSELGLARRNLGVQQTA